MWLALANAVVSEAGKELRRDVEAISRFADELRVRLSSVDGLEGALELQTRLRSVLDAVSSDDLAAMRAKLAALLRLLADVVDRLECLRRVKAAVAR